MRRQIESIDMPSTVSYFGNCGLLSGGGCDKPVTLTVVQLPAYEPDWKMVSIGHWGMIVVACLEGRICVGRDG
jgi:hypothetical protein